MRTQQGNHAADAQKETKRLLEHEKEDYHFEEVEGEISVESYAEGHVTCWLIVSVIVSLFGSLQYGCKSTLPC